MKKILSIDGGGIRGVIAGQIVVAIEKELQRKSGNREARVAQYFDFFSGTSTGGILTCLYLCPDLEIPSKPRFSAEQAVELYVRYGGEIFDRSLVQRVVSADGILDEKFSKTALEQYLNEYFGDLKLSKLLKPCIVTAYDVQRRRTHFFAQHDYARKGDSADFLVKDVCRATSAAPTYFEATLVKSLSGVSYPLIDGGVFANNPAQCAYSEIRNAEGSPTARNMFLVSIGTGSENKPYDYDKVKNYGAVGWIKPVIDIMMSAAAETTHYHLTKMFSAMGNGANYVRIQPSNIGRAHYEMDDASPENIQNLVEVGIETVENCIDIARIVDILLEGKDDVVF
ncbi:MAG: patatin-like phospholipase family protein [Arcticibacter sp.]